MSSLAPLPDRIVDERVALHRLATYVIGPARHQRTGRFGLRSTEGGFGTPAFGEPPIVVRVAVVDGRAALIIEREDSTRSTPLTSLNAAAEFLGSVVDTELAAETDSPAAGDLDAPLEVSAATVACLGAWWELGTAALEVLRADAASVDPTIVQLWPGHFDAAIDVGEERRRASVGASPGDDSSDQPYLYVSVWSPDELQLADDPFWNAEGFVGARLGYDDLASSADPVAAATAFFRTGRDLLAVAPDA